MDDQEQPMPSSRGNLKSKCGEMAFKGRYDSTLTSSRHKKKYFTKIKPNGNFKNTLKPPSVPHSGNTSRRSSVQRPSVRRSSVRQTELLLKNKDFELDGIIPDDDESFERSPPKIKKTSKNCKCWYYTIGIRK